MINFTNLQKAHIAQYIKKKTNNPIKKMGQRSKQTFLHTEMTKRYMKKISNIDNYYRNANQNYNEVTLHPSEWPLPKSLQIINATRASLVAQPVKNPSAMWETWV